MIALKEGHDTTGASGTFGLDPKDIMRGLSQMADENVIVTTDVGQNQIWAGRFYQSKVARSFITSAGLGTMGFSIPSAIGAALANPTKRVLTIVGDGGFQMCSNELATARQEDLHIGILLLNNQSLGMVRELQQHYCKARYSQIRLDRNPDFSHIAAAYGFEYALVSQKDEIEAAIGMLLDPRKAIIVEFAIDASANVVPVKAVEESK
jgi:acetolactate synthase-1/2/3 large subunit